MKTAGAFTFRAFVACIVFFAAMLFSCATRMDVAALQAAYPPGMPYPDSRFVELGGSTVHCRFSPPSGAKSDGGAPLGFVLLLHGLAGSTYSWNYLVPALNSAGYATLAVDLPPFGFSGAASGEFGDPVNAAPLLWRLADSFWTGPWMVVAHSMGGQYAAALSDRAPGRISAAALFAPALGEGGGGPEFSKIPFAKFFVRPYLKSTMSDPKRLSRLLTGAYGRKPLPAELAGYAAPFAQPGKTEAFLNWAFGATRVAQPTLPLAGVPVLLVWGRDDSWVPLKRGIKLNNQMPLSRLEILPGEGHCSMETAPDAVNELVLGFFGKR